MSVIQLLLLKTPMPVLAAGAIVIAVVLSIAGVVTVRWVIGVEKLKRHNDIAAAIYATIGVTYAMLLGFLIITVWVNFDRSNGNVTREAGYYADVHRNAGGLAEPVRTRVRETLKEYVSAIVNEEWPGLAAGERNRKVEELEARLWSLLYDYQPKAENEKVFMGETIRSLNDAAEMRDERLIDARTGIGATLWLVLLMGGIITVGFTFFFGAEDLMAHLTMTTLLSVLIALIVLATLLMDYPFAGDVSITPGALLEALATMDGR